MTFEFFEYGILIYIPASALLSYLITWYENYKPPKSTPEARTAPQRPRNDPPKSPKFIPADKVGHCLSCDSYLIDDYYYYSHTNGKKHKQNVLGQKNWLVLISKSEYENNSKAQKVQKTKVQSSPEDYDEGFIL